MNGPKFRGQVKPTTWFQLGVMGDAIKPGFGRAFSFVEMSIAEAARVTGWRIWRN